MNHILKLFFILLFSGFLSPVSNFLFPVFADSGIQTPVSAIADSILDRRGEISLSFQISDKSQVAAFTKEMSISKVSDNIIYAYLNKQQFINFAQKNIPYTIYFPKKIEISKQKSTRSPWDWDCYPTYKQYLAMMDSFTKAYPSICKLEEIGKSVNGRKILALKISDSASIEQKENEFLYTSTMHGNETTGFLLMLRLINHILSHYDTDQTIHNLVDNLQIWINPVSNPDGLFGIYDSVTYESTRFNAQNIDLNRNFPDPVGGIHPDGKSFYAPENIAMMDFLNKHEFVLSANFHDGAEVVNYPWDTYSALPGSPFNKANPDSAFFIKISQQYADTAFHYGSNNYFHTLYASGITQGNRWYSVYGGRQDYTTYYLGGKEVTIELSNATGAVDITPENMLVNYWNYNYRSLINFMKTALTTNKGIRNSILAPSLVGYNDINIINKGDFIELNLNGSISGCFDIDLINLSGQIEYSTNSYLGNKVLVRIPNNLKGLYLVRLRNKDTHYIQKVLLN